MPRYNDGIARVLSGSGARAAYQVGFMKCLARNFPDFKIPIITGVSAGAISAAFPANHEGVLAEAAADLSALWLYLSVEQVFCVNTWKLIRNEWVTFSTQLYGFFYKRICPLRMQAQGI